MDKLFGFILEQGEIGLLLQKDNGSFPEGINGPHIHTMTPIRNTAHWAITLGFLYSRTHDMKFKSAGQRAYSWLLDNEYITTTGNYVHRVQKGKDSLNGLVGTSWLLESFFYGYLFFKDEILLKKADHLLGNFSYNYKSNLWNLSPEQSSFPTVEITLNQQIWFNAFAAKIQELTKNEERKEQIENFNNSIMNKILIDADDTILLKVSFDFLRDLKYRFYNRNKPNTKIKELPYHIFTLVGMGYLKEVYPLHPIWKSAKMEKILNRLNKKSLEKELALNEYGYGYNVVGFELAYISKVFDFKIEKLDYYLNKQISMSFVIKDFYTCLARQYEGIRYLL